jgi:hypothetical protein
MKIVALDLSKSNTGWAHWDTQTEIDPVYGSEVLGSEYTENGMVFAKLHALLSDIEESGEIDAIFYEDAINILPGAKNTNVHAIKLSAGLIAHVESWGYQRGVGIVHAVNMKSWRRTYFGGVSNKIGRAELKEMSIERGKLFGWKPRNDDEADALGVLDYATSYMGIQPFWRLRETLQPPLGRARK